MNDVTVMNPSSQGPVKGIFGRKPKKKRGLFWGENVAAFLMILPAVISFTVFILLPMCFALVISLCDFNAVRFTFEFIGFENYAELLNPNSLYGETFWMCVSNTLWYLIEVPLTIALGLLLAVLVTSECMKHSQLFRVLLYVPAVCSAVASSIIWREMFYNSVYENQKGFINLILGLDVYWLRDRAFLLTAIIFKNSISSMGRSMILYYAALCNISPEYYEAANLDGANSWQKFWYITFPMLSPTTFYQLIMRISTALQSYADSTLFAAKAAGAQTIVYFVWDYGINQHNYSIASAAALLLGVTIMLVTIFQFRRSNKWVVQL